MHSCYACGAGTGVSSHTQLIIHNLRQDAKPNWFINNALYLQLLELGGVADCDFAISAWVEDKVFYGAIQDVVGSATLDIQPADGDEAVITTFSAEGWAGVAPAGSPDVNFSFYDGTNLSDFIEPGSVADSGIWANTMEIMIDHAHYLRLTEISTANNEIAYSGYYRRRYNP